MSLAFYEYEFSQIKMNSRAGNKSPHKVAMLLAVIDILVSRDFQDLTIRFDDKLKAEFTKKFTALAGSEDRNNPHLPFFHLRTSKFWHHRLRPGKTESYERMTAASVTAINKHIEYAFLDDELTELLRNSLVRKLLEETLLRNLTSEHRLEILTPSADWNWLDLEFISAEYFKRLMQQIQGIRKIITNFHSINGLSQKRTAEEIEIKFSAISTVLVQLGLPYLNSFPPNENSQPLVREVVLAHLAGHFSELQNNLNDPVEENISAKEHDFHWDSIFDPSPPRKIPRIKEPPREWLARKIDYVQRDRNNRRLGELGEEFVLQYECHRLTQAGRADLAKEVEWVSKNAGDGLGYDIRSFDAYKDQELFIEVKTTNQGKHWPFYLTDVELDRSKKFASQYALYRVYEFRHNARIYQLSGAIDEHVNLVPKSYKAEF